MVDKSGKLSERQIMLMTTLFRKVISDLDNAGEIVENMGRHAEMLGATKDDIREIAETLQVIEDSLKDTNNEYGWW